MLITTPIHEGNFFDYIINSKQKNKHNEQCTLHSSTQTFVVDVPRNVGKLKQVLFEWNNLSDDVESITNLYVKSIKVFDVKTQKR